MGTHEEEQIEQNIKEHLVKLTEAGKKAGINSKEGKEFERRFNEQAQGLRKLQMQSSEDKRERMVRSHIERRAELREKTSIRMPNIASILTGGAESPLAGMGRMQRQVSKPFKNVWDYQKAKGEAEDLGKIKKGDRTEKEQDRLDYLESEMGGKESRAKSGFGKNLMGKRMQGMIGKVGKFMESSKGQGMMAGGMMGASILTMVIKKAMEASPMLQAMFKIMNTALTLFLRPIGDFIGGMLKPITMFFLREIAIPMLKKGKDFIKFGEAFGKNILGFLLKPIETIQAAILGVFPFGVDQGLKELALRFDGIKEWMSEQKMNVLASEMGFDSRQDLINMINDAKNLSPSERDTGRNVSAPGESGFDSAAWAEIEAEFGTGWVATLQNVVAPLDRFRDLMTDVSDNTYTYVIAQEALETSGLAVAGGMGAVVKTFPPLVEEIIKVITAFETLAGTIPGGVKPEYGTNITSLEDYQESLNLPTEDTEITPTGGSDVTVEEPKNWKNIAVYDTPSKMLARLMQMIGATTGATPDAEAVREYKVMTQGGLTPAEAIQKRFNIMTKELERLERIAELEATKREELLLPVNEMAAITSLELFQRSGINDDVLEMATDIAKTQGELRKILAAIRKGSGGLGGGGGSSNPWTISNMIKSGTSLESYAASVGVKIPKKQQHGGMINEYIWGIGASGQTYTFGEAGPEMVTPMTGGKNTLGNITANITVNIEKVLQDVDLEQIKPHCITICLYQYILRIS